MSVRKIVKIDLEKCNGCGQCVPNCHEGALRIVNGKAVLVADNGCDGLGACLGYCPQGAIALEEREAAQFDAQMVSARQAGVAGHADAALPVCPGAALCVSPAAPRRQSSDSPGGSALAQWPVQLGLLPPSAPFLKGADLLLCADCIPFAMAEFHDALLRGRRLVVACPKLDDARSHLDKLTAILRDGGVRLLTVAHMEVPCCYGLVRLAEEAVRRCGRPVPLSSVQVSIHGDLGTRAQGPEDAGARSPLLTHEPAGANLDGAP